MTPQELRERTDLFARNVRNLATPLLRRIETSDIAAQLRRASSSVASNYRAAGRARSHKEFTAKLGIVLEEADESQFWLNQLWNCGFAGRADLEPLLQEANELVSIFTKSAETARRREREDHK